MKGCENDVIPGRSLYLTLRQIETHLNFTLYTTPTEDALLAHGSVIVVLSSKDHPTTTWVSLWEILSLTCDDPPTVVLEQYVASGDSQGT